MIKDKFSFALRPFLVWALLALTGCTEAECPKSDPVTQSITVNGHTLRVEIAATTAERACGLSQRPHLADNHGMLFVFRGDRIREFWMKDTLIPLTIAYLDDDGRILDLYAMEPSDSKRRYRSSAPARYALETHRHWFRANGIQVGDRVEFRLSPELTID